jgi:hypothetical protein
MTRTRTNTIYHDESQWFFLALSIFAICFIAYGYFVSASVMHVVAREDVDRAILDVSTTIGELESEYIEAQHAVSADIASLHGFSHTNKKVFIDMSDTTLVLSD